MDDIKHKFLDLINKHQVNDANRMVQITRKRNVVTNRGVEWQFFFFAESKLENSSDGFHR